MDNTICCQYIGRIGWCKTIIVISFYPACIESKYGGNLIIWTVCKGSDPSEDAEIPGEIAAAYHMVFKNVCQCCNLCRIADSVDIGSIIKWCR